LVTANLQTEIECMKMSLQQSYFIWEYKITIVQVKMVLANI